MKPWHQITADDVLDAYAAHPEVKPIFHSLFNLRDREDGTVVLASACAIGILVVADGFLTGTYTGVPYGKQQEAVDYVHTIFTPSFRFGLEAGFDGAPAGLSRESLEYVRGYKVGREARERVLAQRVKEWQYR